MPASHSNLSGKNPLRQGALRLHSLLLSLFVLLNFGNVFLLAAPVSFSHVEATFCSGTSKRSTLLKTIDGIDAGKEGWSVFPETQRAHAAVFTLKDPVSTGRLRMSLLFLSGQQNTHFSEFSLSATSDPEPTLNSTWELLSPWLAYSTGTQLDTGLSSHLQSRGSALNTEFIIESLVQLKPITGIRIDVYPNFRAPDSQDSVVAPSLNHDFTLTEFRVEAFDTESSNVALGSPVRASHAIWGDFKPEYLTDGLQSTFAHPKSPTLGDQFFFEIDLGRSIPLDHLTLRGRADGQVPERLSKLVIALFEEPPDSDISPVWTASLREDGSYPPIGSSDVIRVGAGRGTFQGRYLRISSNSPISYSPQIAEIEAYEAHLPELQQIRADESNIPIASSINIPANTRWLAFSLKAAGLRLPKTMQIRWRLSEFHRDWQTIRSEGVAQGPCPPPGSYQLEAQIGHTDGEWDHSTLRIMVEVLEPWWMHRPVQFTAVLLAILLVSLGFRHLARRRLATELLELERLHALDEERSRIARDMHDVVGARLTQLSVMHDIFSTEHALPKEAVAGLSRLNRVTREAISALDEVVWTVNPRNDSLPNLADYLCHCASEYLQPLNIRCLQEVPTEWMPLSVQAQTRHEVLLAFKEALQNIAKHSGANQVTLTLHFLPSRIFQIRLEDNGKGLPAEITGLQKDGLANMAQRLEKIGGHCLISKIAQGGTSVLLEVPL